MRHRFLCVVVLVVLLSVILVASPAAAQTATQERSPSSQQQMKAQPAQTTIKQVKPVQPMSPVKTDLKLDAHAGDIAVAGATDMMVIDLQGDGLDLGGRAKIRVGGTERDTNWTRPDTADAFLVMDAAVLREMGFELNGADGVPIQARILLSDGVHLRTPDGNELSIPDAWQLLDQFDANHDGKIDSSDAAWQGLSLFVDQNADGTMAADELFSLADSTVREFSLERSSARADVHGNTLTGGTFTRSNGTTGTLAGVKLRY